MFIAQELQRNATAAIREREGKRRKVVTNAEKLEHAFGLKKSQAYDRLKMEKERSKGCPTLAGFISRQQVHATLLAGPGLDSESELELEDIDVTNWWLLYDQDVEHDPQDTSLPTLADSDNDAGSVVAAGKDRDFGKCLANQVCHSRNIMSDLVGIETLLGGRCCSFLILHPSHVWGFGSLLA